MQKNQEIAQVINRPAGGLVAQQAIPGGILEQTGKVLVGSDSMDPQNGEIFLPSIPPEQFY